MFIMITTKKAKMFIDSVSFGISATQIQRTIERFENADILVGNPIGRSMCFAIRCYKK